MLNPFPIQFLSLAAYFLLRLVLGTVLIKMGVNCFKKRKDTPLAWILAILEIGSGTLFILGLYTQIASLLTLFLVTLLWSLRGSKNNSFAPNRTILLLVAGIAVSLFITGAGAFSFDLPI